MKTPLCERVSDLLEQGGTAALKEDRAAQEHLLECGECFALLEALDAVEKGFEGLEEYDAPEEAVTSTLERIRNETMLQAEPEALNGIKEHRLLIVLREQIRQAAGALHDAARRFLTLIRKHKKLTIAAIICALLYRTATGFAAHPEQWVSNLFGYIEGTFGAMLLMAAMLAAVLTAMQRHFRFAASMAGVFVCVFITRSVTSTFFNVAGISGMDDEGFVDSVDSSVIQYNDSRIESPLSSWFSSKKSRSAEVPSRPLIAAQPEAKGKSESQMDIQDFTMDQDGMPGSRAGSKDYRRSDTERSKAAAERDEAPEESRIAEQEADIPRQLALSDRLAATGEGGQGKQRLLSNDSNAPALLKPQSPADRLAGNEFPVGNMEALLKSDAFKLNAKEKRASDEKSLSRQNYSEEAAATGKVMMLPGQGGSRERRLYTPLPGKTLPSQGRIVPPFWQDRLNVKNLSFKEPRGYWANTYVPGDPALYRLAAQFSAQNRAQLASALPALKVAEMSRQTSQPFDAPQNSALAVYLKADAPSIQQESRLLLQVGLKATDRQSGTRPPMNIGLVLDLRGKVERPACEALLKAFSRARDIGDRFSLTVAGRPGGLIIAPGEFRHGTVAVALSRLFNDEALSGEALSLSQAIEKAIGAVRENDDPNSTLGSSAVILITGQQLGGEAQRIVNLAAESAVAGISVSAIGVGERVSLENLDSVALAGQGNRRQLLNPAEAEALVQRELTAVSRVVARAVRLNIRLGAGVKLVDVLGSYRVDEAAEERIRQAEQSIDRRISRNLGIEADRGRDEDGIQIVIPVFYAGDSHAILLDVVAGGAGPVAEVTARYKDLVFLKNGVAHDELSLGRDNAARSRLELNVIKNYLALRTSESLRGVAAAVARGDYQAALGLISGQKQTLEDARLYFAGLSRDPDLVDDLNMLAQFMPAIASIGYSSARDRRLLADSLDFSGMLKVLPRPVVN